MPHIARTQVLDQLFQQRTEEFFAIIEEAMDQAAAEKLLRLHMQSLKETAMERWELDETTLAPVLQAEERALRSQMTTRLSEQIERAKAIPAKAKSARKKTSAKTSFAPLIGLAIFSIIIVSVLDIIKPRNETPVHNNVVVQEPIQRPKIRIQRLHSDTIRITASIDKRCKAGFIQEHDRIIAYVNPERPTYHLVHHTTGHYIYSVICDTDSGKSISSPETSKVFESPSY